MKFYIAVLLSALVSPLALFAQDEDEFFHEIEIAYTYVNNEKWRGVAAANWKHSYDGTGWRRWGGDAYISRKLKIVSFEAGITANYTFDKDIVNYFEARPWIALRTDIQLGKRLSLMQKFKTESRHFFYNNTYANEHRIRNRFLLSLKYNFIKNRDDWKLNPTGEWYFVGKNANAERFSNSVEFGIKIIKAFRNQHEIALGYKQESYKSAFISDDRQGHTFTLEYAF